jgi:hypothetical protein
MGEDLFSARGVAVAVSQVVQARARLRERLQQQEAALAAALRCADAVEAARAKQRESVEQYARLVAKAEQAHATAVAALAKSMGSADMAAGVLNLDVAVVRKAVGANATTHKRARRAKPTGNSPADPNPQPRPADEAS